MFSYTYFDLLSCAWSSTVLMLDANVHYPWSAPHSGTMLPNGANMGEANARVHHPPPLDAT